jgi:pSer/pThr/pTyr-binding forkhead associated (FHA) protein
MSEPFIEVFSQGKRLMEVPLEGEIIHVGRDAACTIHLDDHAISRNHAEVRRVGDAIEVLLSSRFGRMMVNGAETERARLVLGDRVEIGPYLLVLQHKPEPEIEVAEPEPSQEPAPELDAIEMPPAEDPVQDSSEVAMSPFESSMPVEESIPMAALEEPVFSIAGMADVKIEEAPKEIFLESDSSDRTRAFESLTAVAELIFSPGSSNSEQYEILDQEISLGRAPNCHVVLEDEKSSRKHALILRQGQVYVLRDLGSANGTFLNGVRVSESSLSSGDQIKIGNTTFEFRVRSKDYAEKERDFLPVEVTPDQSIPSDYRSLSPGLPGYPMPDGGQVHPDPMLLGQPASAEVPIEKKSAIGKFLDYYRTLPPRMQIIYAAAIIGVFYMVFFDEDPNTRPSGTQVQQVKKPVTKKDADGKVGLPSFEEISPEQKRYVVAQYQLAIDNYKNRDYSKAIFEVDKIFQIVSDFKQAREIRSYAQEAQAKIEQEEKNRRRKELEKEQKVKLDALTKQAGTLMAKKKYAEAESIFAEIEIIEPENAMVNAWRNEVIADRERKIHAKEEAERVAALRKKFRAEMAAIVARRQESKDYYFAIDELSDLKGKEETLSEMNAAIDQEIDQTYKLIADERDPLLSEGRAAEARGELAEAYNAFAAASKVDPEDKDSKAGMKRIKSLLEARSKHIYIEAVFAESLGDVETAKQKFQQILNSSTKDDSYHEKAQAKLRRLTILDGVVPPTSKDGENP